MVGGQSFSGLGAAVVGGRKEQTEGEASVWGAEWGRTMSETGAGLQGKGVEIGVGPQGKGQNRWGCGWNRGGAAGGRGETGRAAGQRGGMGAGPKMEGEEWQRVRRLKGGEGPRFW